MKNRGFTLIELLVVILIIGILAAIALPKYQTAVAKSQISKYFSLAKSLAEAQESYYLANGKYAISLKDLDVSVPSSCMFFTNISSRHNVYCDNNIVIDNQRSYVNGRYIPTGRIAVRYCPGIASQGESICTTASRGGLLSIDFFLNHHETKANEIHCRGWNQKGKTLCKKLYSGQMILD